MSSSNKHKQHSLQLLIVTETVMKTTAKFRQKISITKRQISHSVPSSMTQRVNTQIFNSLHNKQSCRISTSRTFLIAKTHVHTAQRQRHKGTATARLALQCKNTVQSIFSAVKRQNNKHSLCNTHTHTTIFMALFPGLPG